MTTSSLSILAIEPFFGGSHASFLKGFAGASRHSVGFLTLPPRFWKWRMQGGTVTLARQYMAMSGKPDCILCSDMLDVPTFRGLIDAHTAPPIVLYMHENQLSYPWSPVDRDRQKGRDRFFGFRNFVSVLSADVVIFNSRYNRESFFQGVECLLKTYPDYQDLFDRESFVSRVHVLPPAVDFSRLIAAREPRPPLENCCNVPRILWNHRWEYDKNPGDFFRALSVLDERRREFSVVVAGESTDVVPVEFREARKKLDRRIVHWGYAESELEYGQLLRSCSMQPVTSRQEFFGMSVVEAMYSGCVPLLPKRLAYPELLDSYLAGQCLYNSFDQLVETLDLWIRNRVPVDTLRVCERAECFGWDRWIECYDRIFESVLRRASTTRDEVW